MKKWLDQRAITSPLLSELNRNAKEAGWQRPQVIVASPTTLTRLQVVQSAGCCFGKEASGTMLGCQVAGMNAKLNMAGTQTPAQAVCIVNMFAA